MIPVMIVEDEFLVRVGLRSMIDWEKHGFYVVADASNGEKGFALFMEHHPYLIITDIRMAPMSGLEMINEIRKIDDKVKFIIITAYSEFEYAKEAIRYGVELYLNKADFKNEEIVQVLNKLASQYQTSSQTPAVHIASREELLDVLPHRSDEAALEKWFSELGIASCEKLLLACRYDRSVTQQENWNLIINIFSEVANGATDFNRIYNNGHFIVVLLEYSDPEAIELMISHFTATLKKYTNSPIYFGLSAPFTSPHKIFQALNEACKTCNDFLFDKSVYVRRFSTGQSDCPSEEKLKITGDEIQSCVFSKNTDKIDRLIRNAVFSAPNSRTLEKVVFSIILSLEKFDRSILVSAMANSIIAQDSLEGIYRSLSRWAQSLSAAVSEEAHNDYIDNIIEYVKTHLEEDISLKALSTKYHLSPNYLGKLFFQKTGTYLNTYVTNRRISRACELLLNSNLSISEIHQRVGIENPHYFSSLFKERMGVSPSKYKKTCMKKIF